MAQIIWHKRATQQFQAIQTYLLEEFGKKAAKEFTFHSFQFLELLQQFPTLGTIENPEKNIRGFVLHRHTTLLYKSVNEKIYLLAFFDNRQNPSKK
ncbi:type II toxin-antitoxin system RelE/ParE family toxin [Rufibacter sp. LB8]|uniref:type II toxin-antitoxin system RelE/ParE family toxin n=1 Tax=Rufibacter sp. LB8 TaxID=2777781 RepID=UPI00178C29FE|nr:type II toxin-antitoxin system RelE/ParE family toxin [Rufibacter sp. LB8]